MSNFKSPYAQRSNNSNGYNASPSQFAGGGGGGGFVNSPSGGYDAGSGEGSRKAKGQQTLAPYTIKQLLSATQAHPDDVFKIDRKDVSQIRFVGKILKKTENSTNFSFIMDDGTGTISVRIWTENEETDYHLQKRETWKEGRWARVIGQLRDVATDGRFVTAFDLRAIEDYNEITYHFLETIQVHLYNTKGPIKAAGMGGTQYGGVPTTQNASGYNNNNNAGSNMYNNSNNQGASFGGNFSDVQRRVLEVFHQEPDTDNGTHIDIVLGKLKSTFNENQLRGAIDFLTQEGHLYSTSDEYHFKSTTTN